MTKPNSRSIDGLLHICYDLPHRVHTSKIYPLSSPNGSTIIVYCHEQGIRIVWRGGRPLKEDQNSAKSGVNCNDESNDPNMVSGEPGDRSQAVDELAFEDEDDEYDPSAPYESIIQTSDLPLGVEVLHLAFPTLPPDLQRTNLPPLVSKSILMAITCSDCTVRLLSFPLMPPPLQRRKGPDLKNMTAGESLSGEQMITLTSGITHQSIPRGVSISMTAASLDDSEDADMEAEDEHAERLPASRHTSRSRSLSALSRDQSWDLLIASHSTDVSGLLLVHRIPIVSEGNSISTETHIPWRVQHLASPAMSLAFSSALYPAPQHSQILVTEAKSSVRIFDCLTRSTTSQGRWLLSLHTDFETPQNSLPRRKPILDAQWILGGKAIMVLQADGQWGIWNHEGRGPRPSGANNSSRNQSAGLLTAFAISGWVGASLKSKPLVKSSNAIPDGRAKLSPMTPSTRKMKQDALFSNPSSISTSPARGGLSVTPIHNPSSSRPDDESILIWHGTTAMIIPSLFTHWQNKVRGSGNLFGSGAKGEPKTINNIQLGGERCNEIHLIPPRQREESRNLPEVLVTGEKRLLLITSPLTEPDEPSSLAHEVPLSNDADQMLLENGDLDVDGMDRIMDNLSNGRD